MNDAPPPGPLGPVVAMTHINHKVAEFVDQVEALFSRSTLDSFWSCEASFRGLLRSGFASDVLKAELEQVASDTGYVGDWQPNQLLVHRGRGFALSLALMETPRRYIHTSPFYGMYSPMGRDPLRYDVYRLPAEYRNEVFDPKLKLEPAGSGETAPGEVLLLRSNEYAYDFKLETPVLLAKFTSAPFHTLEWLFSKESLHPWQANDSELPSTQLRVAAYLLGRLAHQSSLEPLNLLTAHPHHAVRWAAIQALGRISRTEALVKLEVAQYDPHPHVRRAAAKTLQQFKPKD